MKRIILCFVVSALAIFSQELVAQNHVYFRAGPNSSTIASRGFKPFFGQNRSASSKYESGFLISTGIDFQLKNALHLRTELNYLRENASINHSGYEIGDVRIFSMTESWSSHQLQIPVLLRWQKQIHPLLLGAYAGPGLSFLLSGQRTTYPGQVFDQSLEEEVANPEDYHLFHERNADVSLILGAEVGIQTPNVDFILEGRMTNGFVNFDEQEAFAFYQKSFAFLAGFRFKLAPNSSR